MEGFAIFFLFMIWVVFGLFASAIAEGKGRSAGGGFALGLLLGPFGIIWALFMSKNQAKVDDKAVKSGKMKKCHACAEVVKLEATKCRHCGEALNT